MNETVQTWVLFQAIMERNHKKNLVEIWAAMSPVWDGLCCAKSTAGGCQPISYLFYVGNVNPNPHWVELTYWAKITNPHIQILKKTNLM